MSVLSCWQKKQVINVCDGKCLGFICDLEIDPNTGEVIAIIVPNRSGLFWWCIGKKDYVIPWCNIRKIGDDVIMVDIRNGVIS